MVLADKADRVPQDLTRIGLEEEWEVRYWCERFSVGEDDHRACVMEVGPRAADVESRLRVAARKSFWNDGED